MPYIQDTTQSFTITLTTLLEGFGTITYIAVYNITQMKYYEWIDGMWQTLPPEAVEADSVAIYVEAKNEGVADDTLFAEFGSADVTPAEPALQELTPDPVPIGAYGSIPIEWSFTMPPNAVNITINAGHVE